MLHIAHLSAFQTYSAQVFSTIILYESTKSTYGFEIRNIFETI